MKNGLFSRIQIWSVLREKVYRSKIAINELKTRLIEAQFHQSIADAAISQ